MTQRSFDDAFWGDPFVQELDKDAKLLFIYLWTNKHCNSAGLYEITIRTIAFDTGLDEKKLPDIFDRLKHKVKWLPDCNTVWVINFLKRQPKSKYYMISVARCLPSVSNNGVVKEFIDYYKSKGVSIPSIDGLDTAYKGSIDPAEIELEIEIDKEIGNYNNKQNKKYPPEFNEMRKTVFEELKTRRGYTSRSPNAEAKAISQMLLEKFIPEQILRAYDIIKKQPFFQDKDLSMMQVRKNIYEVLKSDKGKLPNEAQLLHDAKKEGLL